MKITSVRTYALALPEVVEEPHFHFSSFRVRGKIFVTIPPDEEHLHVFVDDPLRESSFALHPEYLERLSWGKKVVGLRVSLKSADARVVKHLVLAAWRCFLAASKRTPVPTSLAIMSRS